MTVTHLNILDRSVEEAHVWSNDLAEELGTDDRQFAYRVLRAYLHALRDHLSVDEAAQLPIFIRGVFYEGWDPTGAPERDRDVDAFLRRVAREAVLSGETQASVAVNAASRVVSRHVSAGETASMLHMLPKPLRELLAPDRK